MLDIESIIDAVVDDYSGEDPWAFEDEVTNTIEKENE